MYPYEILWKRDFEQNLEIDKHVKKVLGEREVGTKIHADLDQKIPLSFIWTKFIS